MKQLGILPAIVGLTLMAGSIEMHQGPVSPQVQSGKDLYAPIRKPVELKEEKRIQQENGMIGGRGEAMHSYPTQTDKNSHETSSH